MSLEFFSAPIFKFKVSIDPSHQARLNGVVLLKINQAVLEILMKNHFIPNMFFFNISGTGPSIFKFKGSMDSSHQARLNGVVLLKIDQAVLEILMKNHFVLNLFF